MPSPQINFPDEKAELRYGLKVLVEAGLTPEQIQNGVLAHRPHALTSRLFVA